MSSIQAESHLGGHLNITHIDEGTLTYLIKRFSIKSMIDIGQGTGGMVKLARSKGLLSIGIDGDASVEPDVLIDYSQTSYTPDRGFDLAWSVEFLEHVESSHIDNFMDTFGAAKYILCTAARPGEPGHHHVNCQEPAYWVAEFAKKGFVFDLQTTELIRHQFSTMNIQRPLKKQFVKRNGLFFIKQDVLAL